MTEPYLTTKQLAESFSLSERWVTMWVAKGMPRKRIGGMNRFLLSEVLEFFGDQERAA